MIGLAGLGALTPCGNPTLGGYFYKDEGDMMVSDYIIPQYDGNQAAQYQIDGVGYWYRSGGKDVDRCPNLQPVSTTNTNIATTVVTTTVPVNTTNGQTEGGGGGLVVGGFDLSSIPMWGYAVAGVALVLMFKGK